MNWLMTRNLINHTVSMINKYFDGQIPAYVEGVTEFDHVFLLGLQNNQSRLPYTRTVSIHVRLKQSGL